MWSKHYTYDEWMEAQGIPIYRGYYIEDLRTLELGWWDERQCNSAFIQLVGQEGVTSARVTEIPPGKTLPPLKFALDEIVYVVEGRGLTTIWAGEKRPKKTFEWQKHSMFLAAAQLCPPVQQHAGRQAGAAAALQLHAADVVRRARCQFHLRQSYEGRRYPE